jgi:membrane protein DedA with SNARE-associated domain
VPAEPHVITQTIHFVERHGYAVLFCWVLAEQGAFPLPSIPLLLAAGSLIRTGKLHAALALAACVSAALIADSLWFHLGRTRGTRVLRWMCRLSLEPDSCVRRTENVFTRYGLRGLLVAKFVPGLNAVAAPLAGISLTPTWRFLLYDAAGAALWSGVYLALGYLFTEQLETVLGYASRMGLSVFTLIAAIGVLWILWKLIQRRRFLHKISIARITPAELADLLASGNEPYIIDLRSAGDPLPLPHSTIRITPEELAAGRHPIPRDREVVLACT